MPNQETSEIFNLLSTSTSTASKTVSGNRLLHLIGKGMMIEGKDCLAEEFDVSITTVERWIREGVPKESTNSETLWRFHRGRVARWRRENHGGDLN